MRFGLSDEQWQRAKEEIREILIERAKVRGTIPYSLLTERIKSVTLEPDSYALAHLLGEVSTAEDRAGRGMLSVVVVHKEGDMQPGPGFFKLAKELGRDASDIPKCWIDELKKVHAYWSNR